MQHAVTIEGEVTDDGRLVAEIPADAPRGRVLVTLVPSPESTEDLVLTDDDLEGQGLSAEEIARSPEIGAWKASPEIPDGASYEEQLRRRPLRYSW